MNPDRSQNHAETKVFWGSRSSIGLIVLGGIALYFLLTEHRTHFFGALPFLLLLACPLMHFFMHGGHNGHSGSDDHQQDGKQQTPKTGDQS